MILAPSDPDTRLDRLTGEQRAAVLATVVERCSDVRARVWKYRAHDMRTEIWREERRLTELVERYARRA